MECDLVLLTWNHLEVTQSCLESLFAHTDLPSRLVIVDNGSDQTGVKEYLESIKPSGSIRQVTLLRNEQDLGFSKGMNSGLRFCLSQNPAPYLCVISNDVIFTQGWLSELVCVPEKNPTVGLVNPNSTNFGFYPPAKGNRQEVESKTRTDKRLVIDEINKYGVKISYSFKGRWQELGSCIGFCMLVKREVLEKIGLFDEVYGMAYYEDADLSKRAQSTGYICALARGSYVYHEQGESFGKHREKSSLFLKNEELFYSRWKMPKPGRLCYIFGNRSHEMSGPLFSEIKNLANQFNKIWILFRGGENGHQMFRHWNVQERFFRGPSVFFYFWVLVYLLSKKKRFSMVFIDTLPLLTFLKNCQKRYQSELRLFSIQ